MVAMTKTISARIPDDVHAELLERCNREGCTVNYFLNKAIEFIFDGCVDFAFGGKDEDSDSEEQTSIFTHQ